MNVIGLKRNRLIKLCCVLVLFILIVTFFLPKPKGKEFGAAHSVSIFFYYDYIFIASHNLFLNSYLMFFLILKAVIFIKLNLPNNDQF